MPATAKKKPPLKVTLRIYEEEEARLERIAKAMSGPGNPAGPTEAVRYVLERGYENAERELGVKTPTGKKASK